MPDLIPALNPVQQRVIDTIYSVFKETREWPNHQYLERHLDDGDEAFADINDVLRTMPGLYWPFNRAGGVIWHQPSEKLGLRARGLACCSGADEDVALFVESVRWLVAQWRAFRPTSPQDATDPVVEAIDLFRELPESLGRSPAQDFLHYQVLLIFELFQAEPFLPTAEGMPEEFLHRRFRLSRELNRFRHVASIEEYLGAIPDDTEPVRTPGEIMSQITTQFGAASVLELEHPDHHMSVSEGRDTRRVMVVYGRNARARDAMFTFLRALGLIPTEWEQAVAASGEGSPHNLTAVRAAMRVAQAVVVLLTAEDEARLLPALAGGAEASEAELRGQPRQNVILEAGLAMGTDQSRTILVELGPIRRASDFDGLNVVRLDNTAERRSALRSRLEAAGCAVEPHATDWMSANTGGDFDASVVSGGTA